jgi:predicted nucleic acid-binding protein
VLKMKVYIDLCVYNRPFDDQHQPRIVIESLEFAFILSKVIDREITTINSFVLEDENSKNPYIDRRHKISDILELALEYIDYDLNLVNRAKELEIIGIMPIDALHIACAEKAKANFFITCDDFLVRKGKSKKDKIGVEIITLMEFITREVFIL